MQSLSHIQQNKYNLNTVSLRVLIYMIMLTLISCYSASNKQSVNIQEFTGGTFDINVKLIVTKDRNAALREIKTVYSDATLNDLESRGTTFVTREGKPIVIWLPSLDDESVLLHELAHVTRDIFRWSGTELNDSTEEIFCFEIQYLYNQIKR